MAALNTAAALLTLAALFSWVNHRFIRWPTTIALLLFSLAVSLGVIALGTLGIHFDTLAVELLEAVDFDALRTLRWSAPCDAAGTARSCSSSGWCPGRRRRPPRG